MPNPVIFWHRKDLRIEDNLGLILASQKSQQVIPIFCLDTAILNRQDTAEIRVEFMLRRLLELKKEYQKAGSDLYIFLARPEIILPQICEKLSIQEVFWNLDVENFARKRDRLVFDNLEKNGVKANFVWDQLLHSPTEIFSQSGSPYTVFTPFLRTWLSKKKLEFNDQKLEFLTLNLEQKTNLLNFQTEVNLKDLTELKSQDLSLKNKNYNLISSFLEKNEVAANLSKLYPVESQIIEQNWQEFLQTKVANYQTARNFPALDETSKLSPYLKFGIVSIRQIWRDLEKKKIELSSSILAIESFQAELAWREFYQHAMYHFPRLETEPFRQSFSKFIWDWDEKKFEAWCEGKTGFPLVDAAMRQLNTTGWMHNRLRMVVASFLTKDLLINWQKGEQYFMQKLIDGDVSSNNGGWQWSASCGLDPKPLRIFNPNLQAQKYDPEAKFIFKWLPELSGLNPKMVIANQIPSLERKKRNYHGPIVDHKASSSEFKKRYLEIRN